jgi:hypothetical protein
VLLLLPLIGKPLQAKYCGPYVVLKRLGEVDYVISTPDRRKIKRVVHVNLLKRYLSREMAEELMPNVNVVLSGKDATTTHDKVLLPDVLLDHLTVHQRQQLMTMLHEFQHVFGEQPGRTTLIEHSIQLVDGAKPVRQAPYRLHPEKLRSVNAEISDLLKAGIIEESESPWAAPIVVVPKSDGSGRLCTDFRRLNLLTVADPFPMPRIDSLLDKLGGAKFMTKLDMTKGYWQIPIAESSIPLTGFVTPSGHFQWRFMSFGLRNAPSTFSRLVRKLFKEMEEFCDA